MKPGMWWGLLVAAVVVSVAVVGVPVFLIQPFRDQSEADLALSHAMRAASSLVTVATLLVAAVAAWNLGRTLAGWRRAVPLAALLLVAMTAWFARQNHFEWMFAPLPNGSYVRAAQADFVRPDDLVLGVVLNGDAVAYPVNQLAYHHVVNDEVGGVPIAATY